MTGGPVFGKHAFLVGGPEPSSSVSLPLPASGNARTLCSAMAAAATAACSEAATSAAACSAAAAALAFAVCFWNASASAQCFLHNLRQWSAVPWRGLRLCVSAWVSVGRPSPLGRALAHRIRVMGGCVIWVRWAPHRYLGWYAGPGLSLRCFRLLF